MAIALFVLKKKNEIKQVSKNGTKKTGRFIFIRILKNNLEINRFVFIVSTKVSKSAVKRNKIKRRLREIIRHTILKPGKDVLIFATPKIINKNYQEIKQEVESLL